MLRTSPRTLTRLGLLPALLALLILPGCGDEESTGGSAGAMGGKSSASSSSSSEDTNDTPPTVPVLGRQEVPSALAALLPAQSHVVVMLSSVDDAEATLARLPSPPGEGFDPEDLFSDSLAALQVYQSGVIANDRPLAVGIQFSMGPMGPEPRSVMVIPVTDTSIAAGAAPGSVQVGDGYVACTDFPSFPALGTSVRGLPSGTIAVHVDLASVIAQFRPMVEPMLQMLPMMAAQGSPGADPQALSNALQPIVSFVTAFFDSAERYELSIDRAGTGLALHGNLISKPGSRMASWFSGAGNDVWENAGSLAEDAPMSMMMVGDWAALARATEPLLEGAIATAQLPEGEAFSRYFSEVLDCYRHLGPVGTFALSLDAQDKMNVDMIFSAKDDQVIQAFATLFGNPMLPQMGLRFREGSGREFEGSAVRTWDVEYDFEKLTADDPNVSAEDMKKVFLAMYPEQQTFEAALHDGRATFAFGGPGGLDGAARRAGRSPSALGTDLQQAVARISDASFGFAGQLDMTRFATLIASVASTVEPGGTPVSSADIRSIGPSPILGYFAANDTDWKHGATISKDSLERMVEVFQKMEAVAPGGF